MRSGRWLGVLALAAMVGCTSGGGDGEDGESGDAGPGGEGAFSIEAAAEAVARIECAFLERCRYGGVFEAVDRMLIEAEGDCVGWMTTRHRRYLEDALASDGHRFDLALFERCAAEALETCHTWGTAPGCSDVYSGSLAEGEPCISTTSCQAGLYCGRATGVGEGDCPTVCRPRTAPGTVCQNDSDCADAEGKAALCMRPGDAVNGTCAVVELLDGAAVNEPCGRVQDADGGWALVACGDGAYCDVYVEGGIRTGLCRPNVSIGEDCNATNSEYARCEGGACVGGRCVEIEVGNVAGAPCGICNVSLGLVCLGGSCVATEGRELEPCDSGLQSAPCERGLYCDEGVCVPEEPDGTPCEYFRECSGGWCNPEASGEGMVCGPSPDAMACFGDG